MRILIAIVAVVAIIGIAVAAGPRVKLTALAMPAVDIDTTDLAALPAMLAGSEARFTDITPGAEKSIVFTTPEAPARTPVALVYLHGFSATRQETDPLTQIVAESLGANVYYARLAGHGRSGAALTAANAEDWLADTAEAYAIGRALGDKVIVIGVSTGATLTAWLAAQPDTDALAGIVLVSPNFGLVSKSADILTMPWGLQLAGAIAGETRTFETVNEGHATYWTSSYGIRAAAEMLALVEAVTGLKLESIAAPTLLVRSDRDTVIDMAIADSTVARFASSMKKTHIVRDSDDPWGHVIAGDILSPGSTDGIATAIVDFVRDIDGLAIQGNR